MNSFDFKDIEIRDMAGRPWTFKGTYWIYKLDEGLTDLRMESFGREIACETDATIPDWFAQSSIGNLIDLASKQMKEEQGFEREPYKPAQTWIE